MKRMSLPEKLPRVGGQARKETKRGRSDADRQVKEQAGEKRRNQSHVGATKKTASRGCKNSRLAAMGGVF